MTHWHILIDREVLLKTCANTPVLLLYSKCVIGIIEIQGANLWFSPCPPTSTIAGISHVFSFQFPLPHPLHIQPPYAFFDTSCLVFLEVYNSDQLNYTHIFSFAMV